MQRDAAAAGRKGATPRFTFQFKLDTEDVQVWRLRRFTPAAKMAELRATRRAKYGQLHAVLSRGRVPDATVFAPPGAPAAAAAAFRAAIPA